MKKEIRQSSIAAFITAGIGGILTALGIFLIVSFNDIIPGVFFGVLGATAIIVTICVWKKFKDKPLTVKAIGIIALSMLSPLLIGVGLGMVLSWGLVPFGAVALALGIAGLVFLIPMIKGFKSKSIKEEKQ